jgi:hypothetical protein
VNKSRKIHVSVLVSAFAILLLVSLTASAQTTGGPYQYYPVNPCRLVDSRINQGATILSGGGTQNVTVKGACGVASTAKVVVINLTGVGPTVDGFLAVWPAGTPYPGTTTVNLRAGEPALANGAIVPLATATPDMAVIFGTAGGGQCHFIVDVVGYFR